MRSRIRLWWVGRILALAKWMQRTSSALNERADRLLNGPKEGADRALDSRIELEVREAIRRVQRRRLPFWWPGR